MPGGWQNVAPMVEREHIRKTIQIHEKMVGERPLGIYQGKPNVNTRRLVVEEGGFLCALPLNGGWSWFALA